VELNLFEVVRLRQSSIPPKVARLIWSSPTTATKVWLGTLQPPGRLAVEQFPSKLTLFPNNPSYLLLRSRASKVDRTGELAQTVILHYFCT